MAKHGKRYIEAAKMVDPEKEYAPLEAAALVKKTATTKFDHFKDRCARRFGIFLAQRVTANHESHSLGQIKLVKCLQS